MENRSLIVYTIYEEKSVFPSVLDNIFLINEM